MSFCVLFGDAEVVDSWFQHITVFWDLKALNLVVRFGVEDTFAIGGEVLSEVNIVAVSCLLYTSPSPRD